MRLFWLPAAAACLALAGCGGTPLPPETDPAKGREILTKVLDTWKAGGTPANLKPIVAFDADWDAGAKLTGYKLDPENQRAGVDLLVAVKMQLTRADGKTQERTINYIVAVGSANTVVVRKE